MIGRFAGFTIVLMLLAIIASQSGQQAVDTRLEADAFYLREQILADTQASLKMTREARQKIYEYRRNLGMFPSLNRLAKLPEPKAFAKGPLARFELDGAKVELRLANFPEVVINLQAEYVEGKKHLRWECEVSNLPESRQYAGTTQTCYAYDSAGYADRNS